jgi:hypothetical protein
VEQNPKRKTLTLKDILYWWVISTLVFTELSIIFFMFLIFCPVPVQKTEKVLTDAFCSYGAKRYEYSFPKSDLEYAIVEDYIKQLNYQVGFDLFVHDDTSLNSITLIPEIKGTYSILTFFMRGETIGLTYCTKMCCGVNNYQVEFSESEFYDPVRTKLLIWHELGHVIGLNHDDSQPDVMNSFILESYKYNSEIEGRYLDKIKKRMGIK